MLSKEEILMAIEWIDCYEHKLNPGSRDCYFPQICLRCKALLGQQLKVLRRQCKSEHPSPHKKGRYRCIKRTNHRGRHKDAFGGFWNRPVSN